MKKNIGNNPDIYTGSALHTVLIAVFAVLLVAGAVLYMFDIPFAEYVFALGAVLAIVQSFVYALQNRTDDRRIARLHRLNFVATLFLGVAAWLMFMRNTSWVPFVLIYAVIVFFLSFRGNNSRQSPK
ncbi:MAG: hypothetical protein IJ776_06010 [Paludibacteraceae bacterium]|nr:hypothetical protein [Paludibacteraceae bacterium]